MRQFFPSLLAVLLLVSRSAAQEYTITDLGTLGGETSEANAINATGQVVGAADTATAGQMRAFLWESGAIFNLGLLSGSTSSKANAINDAGVIVGVSSQHAARFSTSAAPQKIGPDLLPIFGGGREATGINRSGDICGTRRISAILPNTTDVYVPFVVISGVYSELPTLGGTHGYARDIGDSGTVVGTSQIAGNSASIAYQNVSGIYFTVPNLGGTNSRANAINANGDIAGYSDVTGSAFYRAFIYKAGAVGVMVDLGTLARYSEAMALNSQRVAVGYSFDANGVSRAVRFSNGGVADLNRLIKPGSGWLLTIANGINDSGWIVGNGTNPQGKTRGFLLRPDLAPPTVRLAKGGTIRTSGSRFTVKGTASDNVFVKRIEYRVGNGRFLRAKGGSKWSFKATLRPGRNPVGVRAIDGAGNASRITKFTLIRS